MAKSKQTIRIISGTLKGRRLPVLSLQGLRPTGDRLRETLFNWLQWDIAAKNVLDLCAGSGALGFEAASRGALSVTMVESHKQAAGQLQEIVDQFSLKNVNVIHQPAELFLQTTQAKYDVVFVDPPFATQLLEKLSDMIPDRVIEGGYVYREFSSSKEMTFLGNNWHLYRQKIAGQVKIELWQRKK